MNVLHLEFTGVGTDDNTEDNGDTKNSLGRRILLFIILI